MKRKKLLVLNDAEGILRNSPGMDRIRRQIEVEIVNGGLAEIPDHELRDVTALLAVRERSRLDREALQRLPELELILQTGGHAYHLDGAYAASRGITVALGRRAQGPRAAVPELVFALAIGALRHFVDIVPAMADGQWSPSLGRTLSGKTIGILGYGRHGRTVARIARSFGMDVKVWNRTRHAAEDGVEFVSFDKVLAESDVLSIQLRLSDRSRGLIGAAELARMKPRAVLINTARGAIVDENALLDALSHGPLAAAALDVFAEEPLPEDSPLRTHPRILLTPHIGWTVEEVFLEFAEIAADQLEAFHSTGIDESELLDPGLLGH